METLFKKYFWVITLTALTAASYLLASTANDFVASSFLAVPYGSSAGGMDSGVQERAFESEEGEPYAETLQQRRPFNADPPIAAEEPAEDSAGDEEEKKPRKEGELEESELDVQLIGTLVAEDPAQSLATVKSSGTSMLARIGTKLEEKAVLAFIARRYIIVNEDGEQKIIRLWAEKKKDKARRPTPVASSRAPERGSKSTRGGKKKDYSAGVTKVSDTEYEISRSMLDEQLSDLSQLGMEARIVPNYRNGKYQGFKLVGVRPNSLYRAIGIRSGDIVKRINGVEINSPNKAIQLFEQFKSSSAIQMDVERRGKAKAFNYNIK